MRKERKQLILHIVNIILIKILSVEFKVYILKQVRKYPQKMDFFVSDIFFFVSFQVIPKEAIYAFEIKRKY